MRLLIIFLLLINFNTPIFSQENDFVPSDITKDFPKKGKIILACKCLSKERIYSVEIKPTETSSCINIQTALVIDLDNHTLEDMYFKKKILKDINIYPDIIFTNQKQDRYWLMYSLQNYTGFLTITIDYAKAFNGTYYDEYYFQCKPGEKLF